MDIKYGLYDADGDAVAGATLLKVKIKRDADDFFFDFDDTTFKSSAWTTIAEAMSEIDGTNAPGEYELAVTVSSWNDGTYTVYCNYTGSPKQNGSYELVITGGAEGRMISAAAATKLEASAGTIVIGTVSHDNTAASTTVFYSDDITETTADHFNGRIILFTSGNLIYQATDITDYSLASGEGKFTVTVLTEAPADDVTFVIV